MAELTLALLRHGYAAFDRLRPPSGAGDPDAFAARLLGHRALVVAGPEGSRLFYTDVVERHGAVPRPLGDLLFGVGAVHTLDGAEHHERKQMFLRALPPHSVRALGADVSAALARRVAGWPDRVGVRLFDELVEVFGAAVLGWAGAPVPRDDGARLSHDLARIVDGFGFAGPAYLRAWRARLTVNGWARSVVHDARRGVLTARPGSIVDVLAHGAGASLPLPVAAVELVNVVRPTVAVAWLATFAGHALVRHPEHRPADASERARFAQEVRRYYPFVPALAATVRTRTTYRGHPLEPGDRLVLDVPGTNRHPATWDAPDVFDPDRFLRFDPGPHDLVPQGGGDVHDGHRCPGESVTLTLIEATLERLAELSFSASVHRVPRRRIPALPVGGLPVRDVRLPRVGATR